MYVRLKCLKWFSVWGSNVYTLIYATAHNSILGLFAKIVKVLLSGLKNVLIV